MSYREIVEGASRWRWPDAFVWTNPSTGERVIIDPAEVELVWTDK